MLNCLATILDTTDTSIPYAKLGEGFLLLYDVTNPDSFNKVTFIANDLRTARGEEPEPIIFLVANKCDLENERKVTREQGSDLAANFKWSYWETSAKTGQNVEEMFEFLVRLVHLWQITNDNRYTFHRRRPVCALM